MSTQIAIILINMWISQAVLKSYVCTCNILIYNHGSLAINMQKLSLGQTIIDEMCIQKNER